MTEKRRFYGAGNAKGFTKERYFEIVREVLEGDANPSEKDLALALAATEYEIESINLRSQKTSGEKKDALESDYAIALRAAIVPLITNQPKTAKELIDEATGSGQLSPKGTPFAAPWVSRVLNKVDTVTSVKKIIKKTDAKGLHSESEVTAYQRA